jgi:CheY-like chemotaxis protein
MLGTRPIVLVAEDDQANCDLLCELLRDAGYLPEQAPDSQTALTRLEAGGVALLLLDLKLPGADGLTVCCLVRTRERDHVPHLPRLPIVIVTAITAPGTEAACLATGADAYIGKPFELESFLRVVTSLAPPVGEVVGEQPAIS